MPLSDFFLATLILLAAGFLTGVTSFGGNLFAIPLFTFLLGAPNAIAFGCITGAAIFVGLGFIYRHYLLWKEIILAGAFSLIGAPAGVWVLTHAPAKTLLLSAGLFILFFLIWRLLAAHLHLDEKPASRVWGAVAGFASGFMTGAIGMGGPPIVLYAYCRKWPKEGTIGSANLIVFLQLFIVVPMQLAGNLLPGALMMDALWGSIAAFIGILASVPVVHKLNIRVFRAFLLAMLLFSAFILIIRGLGV